MIANVIRRLWAFTSSAGKETLRRVYLWNVGTDRLTLGKGAYLPYGSKIYCKTSIGDNTRINGKIAVRGGPSSAAIGKYCAFGYNVTILTDSHIVNRPSLQMKLYIDWFKEQPVDCFLTKGPVVIGNDVWVGDAVIFLPGVSIGDGAIIGAGAVVSRDVPPYTVVGGVPAKKIKDRFTPEIREQLLALKWWDWPENKIKANKEFFMLDLENMQGRTLADMVRSGD